MSKMIREIAENAESIRSVFGFKVLRVYNLYKGLEFGVLGSSALGCWVLSLGLPASSAEIHQNINLPGKP